METVLTIPNLDRDPTGETWLIQRGLNSLGYNLEEDNWRGKKTEQALADLLRGTRGSWREVKASSFADPEDVESFNRCKAAGGTDMECFRYGDNGIGAWGHITAQDQTPMVALPRDDWMAAGKTGGSKVMVEYKGKQVVALLGDTMPWKKNIKNGAGIDLNPAASKALGLTPPHIISGVKWRWL